MALPPRQVYFGSPASDAYQPKRTDIVALLEDFSDRIAGAAQGLVVQATWSDLSAVEGERTGQPARVVGPDAGTHTDPVVGGTVANTGEYAWSESPAGWRRLGDLENVEFLREQVEAAADARSMLANPGGVIIIDRFGAYGGGPAVYVPQSFYARIVGEAGASKTLGPAASELTGYAKATISATNLTRVYVDLDEDEIVAVAFNGTLRELTTSQRLIVDVQGSTYSSPFRVELASTRPNARLYLNGPLVVDGSKLLVPALAYQDEINNAVTVNPASGLFTELDIPASSAAMFYFDKAANDRAESSIKVSAFDAASRYGGYFITPIAFAYGGLVAPYDQALATIISNEFGFGRDDNDDAPGLYQSSVPVDITNSALTTLGFTRGWGGNNGFPYYGGSFNGRRSGRLFVRFYVQTDTDNNWGDPRLYLQTSSGNVLMSGRVVERTLNARVRAYLYRLDIDEDDGYVGLIAGTHAASGRDMRICGLQYAFSPEQNVWISRADYPTQSEIIGSLSDLVSDSEPDTLIPADLWLREGRPQVLYTKNALVQRNDFPAASIVVASDAPADASRSPVAIENPYSVLLDPAVFNGSAQVVSRQHSAAKASRKIASTTINVAAADVLDGEAPVVHILGDSISRWVGTSPAVKAFLEQAGATPTFVGTMTALSDERSGKWTGTVNGEARGGWEFADYIYMNTDVADPVTDEAAYLLLDDDGKVAFNPYIRPSTGGDDPDNVYNGQIFDFGDYRTRFSIAQPTHVLLNLGTNDLLQQTVEDAIEQIDNGLAAIVSSIVADSPSAKIGIIVNQSATGADAFWDEKRSALIKAVLRFVDDLGDPDVMVVPVWLHQSPEAGWTSTLASTDPDTGLQSRSISDTVHFDGIATAQYAEQVVAWIANTI